MWLAANGSINPDIDVVGSFRTSAAQTVANMKTGTMDAFSTGDPGLYRIVKDKTAHGGSIDGSEVWKNHPEEYVSPCGRLGWQESATTKYLERHHGSAVLDNLITAKKQPDILRHHFNLQPDDPADPFQGKYDMVDGRVNDDKRCAYYWKDEKVSAFILTRATICT